MTKDEHPMPASRIDVLDDISARLARHKLIPFLGAGVSAPQLGVDWNSITADMARELSLPFDGSSDERLSIAVLRLASMREQKSDLSAMIASCLKDPEMSRDPVC